MSTPFAINGLGRIGRALLRAARPHEQLRLVAVNDLAPASALSRLIARDSVYGPFEGEVGVAEAGSELRLDGRSVLAFQEPAAARVPWGRSGARIVVECSGAFRTAARARDHLRSPVEKVVMAWNPEDWAPGDEPLAETDATLCLGINEDTYDPLRHRLISNASCTTNCIAPIAEILHRAYGLRRGLINTIHSYTANQALLDSAHEDPRRARAAAINIVPTPTRAARAVAAVLPELAGRLEGLAVRVPAPSAAMLDLVAELERPVDLEDLRRRFRAAAEGRLRGILGVTDDELVSSDFTGDPHSAVVDLPLLQSLGEHMVRVVAWYDNEWGYANRLAELLVRIAETLEES